MYEEKVNIEIDKSVFEGMINTLGLSELKEFDINDPRAVKPISYFVNEILKEFVKESRVYVEYTPIE